MCSVDDEKQDSDYVATSSDISSKEDVSTGSNPDSSSKKNGTVCDDDVEEGIVVDGSHNEDGGGSVIEKKVDLRGEGSGGNDGEIGRESEGTESRAESIVSHVDSIFGPDFDVERCKNSFMEKVQYGVKTKKTSSNAAVWDKERCSVCYHALVRHHQILRLKAKLHTASDWKLNAREKSFNIETKKKIKGLRKELVYGGKSFENTMLHHWKRQYRLIENTDVQNSDDIFDQYHLYKVKEKFLYKYRDQYAKVIYDEMEGRVYSLDQSFYVLLEEFEEQNNISDDGEINWVNSTMFQNNICSKYTNVTKQLARLFYDSLSEMIDSCKATEYEKKLSESSNKDVVKAKKSTSVLEVDCALNEPFPEKVIMTYNDDSNADYYLSCGIFSQDSDKEGEEIMFRYIFLCDIVSSKCSVSFVRSFEAESFYYELSLMFAQHFNGCGRIVMVEGDGRVFSESNHMIIDKRRFGPQSFRLKTFMFESNAGVSSPDDETKFIPQNNIDGTKSPNIVSLFLSIIVFSDQVYKWFLNYCYFLLIVF